MLLKTTKKNAQRAKTATGKHKVFAYGSLKAGGMPVYARGDLLLRPTGQAAVDFDGNGWIKGEIIEVDDEGLRDLDRREGIYCKPPFYRCVLLKTRTGEVCRAYEWARDFRGFDLVVDGDWSFSMLSVYRARYGARNVVDTPVTV